MIQFACSACNKNDGVADEFAGQMSKCRHCGQELQIPTPATSNGVTEKVKQVAAGAKDFTVGAASSVGAAAAVAGTCAASAIGGFASRVGSLFAKKPDNFDFKNVPEEQKVAFYGCLFAVAAVDGEIDKDEVAAIFETLDPDGMSEAAREKIHSFVFSPPSFTENLEILVSTPPELRYGLMVAMTEVALCDGGLTDSENDLLQSAGIKLAITAEQMEAIDKFVRELQKIKMHGIDDNVAVEGLKAAVAGLGAVGVPLAAVYFSGAVIGFSAAGITSGLAALGLGFGMIPGLGVAIVVGAGIFAGAKWFMDSGNQQAKDQLRNERERRAQLVIKNLQHAIDGIIARLAPLQSAADTALLNRKAIEALTRRLQDLQKLLNKRKRDVS